MTDIFRDDDHPHLVHFVKTYLVKGAAHLRHVTDAEYLQLARAAWASCEADDVYAIKFLLDPLVDPEGAHATSEELAARGLPFIVLIARIDSEGTLVDAPQGYIPPEWPSVARSHMVAGPAMPGVRAPSAPATYIVAFLDVLGFKQMLADIGLDEVVRRYEELLQTALTPNSEARPWTKAITVVQGEPTTGLMYLPIQTGYFSDSLLLWVEYHPAHVAEFLDRCSRVFCAALALGIPLRGAVSVGRALLDKERGIYLGAPLVESVTLEGKSDWVGVCLAASWRSDSPRVPVPPHCVQMFDPPLKNDGGKHFSGLVLDWPRVWRASRSDSAHDVLRVLRHPELPPSIAARYDAAMSFYDYSKANEDWDIPPGSTRVTTDDIDAERREAARQKPTGA